YAFTDIKPGVYSLYASTGESEILFFSGAQVIAASPVSIPAKSLIELDSVELDRITSSSVRLRFGANVQTIAQVEYAISGGSPSTVSAGNSYESTHQVGIAGLVPGTRYGFTVKLQTQDGQALVYPVVYTTTSTSVGPSNLSASINSGDIKTRNLSNRIYLNADGAAQMRVGTSEDLTSQPWETYSTTKDVTFTSGDGTRRVYVQFRDLLGNLSGVINDSILLQSDNTGYLGIWVNNGEALTNKLDVVLTILYPGATQMQISDRPDFLNSFDEKYVTTRKHKISSGDGPKTVYVRFKGGNADENKSFSATIRLDTAGPVVEVKVNNGALKTNASTVQLSFSYSKQPTEMQIQPTNSFVDSAAWLKFANPYKYILTSGDGEKIFFTRFKDSLGNISAPVESHITLDTAAPKDPKMLINNGDEITKVLNVKLTLDVTADDGESVYMILSNNESFTGANLERFSKTRAWTLGGYGLQTVYAMFVDDASNSTTVLVESIEVEGNPPSSSTVKINEGDPSTESSVVSLSVTSEAAKKIRVAEHENFSSVADIPFVANVGTVTMRIPNYQLSPVAGEKRLFVRMEDASGTFSISSDSIILVGPSSYSISTPDSQPLGSFSVNLRPFAVNAAQMLITESYADISSSSLWRPFAYSVVFDLEKFLGKHTVYAKYRTAGNVETPVLSLDVLITEVTPATPAIILNLGDAVTPSSRVQVKVLTSGVYTQMQLSNDGTFFNAAVLPVADTLWDITGFDGQKTVYARFFNPQSSNYEIVTDQITARGPASTSISTRETQPLNKNWVQLDLFADGATDMIVTDDPAVRSMTTGWLPYQNSLVFPLGDQTGPRTVFAKFRNAATNWIESLPVQLNVTINASSPSGNAVAFRASPAVDSVRVTEVAPASMPIYLHFTILDDRTASISWKIVPGGAAIPAAIDMKNELVPVAPIPLTQASFGGYGIYNLYYQFSDGVGNKSALGVTSIRIIDPSQIVTPTTGRITINNGDEVSESSRINLNLYSENAVRVRVAAVESFSTQPDIPFTPSAGGMNIPYDISPPTAGSKRIYARFENASGAFGFASDSITLSGPTGAAMTVVDKLPLNKMWVELSLYAENAGYMLISESLASFSNPAASWKPYAYRQVFPLENRVGSHTIYCKFYNSSTTWVETAMLQVGVSVNATVPSGNTAFFRTTVASASALVSEISPASMPFYLHFQIADSMTATVSYRLVPANAAPPALLDYALPILPVPLNPPDFSGYGTFNLYYSFVDGVGNRSAVQIIPVKILEPGTEYSPVNGTVKINDGDAFTDSRDVSLNLFSTTAKKIKISQTETFNSVAVEDYIANTPSGAMIKNNYPLSTLAGNKNVYVRFEDASGSFIVANDSINLVGPSSYSISTPDAQPLQAFSVHLRPLAEDANQMLITENYADLIAGTGWVPFSFTFDFTLQNFEGPHKIYARYRNAGLVETPVMTLDVNVLSTPEASPTLLINDGDVAVSRRPVILRLFSESAASFTVSESLSFTGATPQTYAAANPDGSMFYPFTLSAAAGNKTVYVRYANASGVYTVVNDSITMNGPTGYDLSTADTQPLATFTLNLLPFAEGANEMLISENYANLTAGLGWASFAYSLPLTLASFEGNHTVYARYRNLGNVETPVMTLVVAVDIPAPATSGVLINYGDLSTGNPAVELRLFSADAASFTVSESQSFSGAPVIYSPTNPDGSMLYPFNLSANSGDKTVYVRFANSSGVLTTVNDGITLSGPTGSSLTTPDTLPLATWSVNLRPFADGVNEMLITENYASLTAGLGWASFSYALPFKLTPSEGNHTIYALYRNLYKVESPLMVLNVTVDIPDPAAPTLTVNNGDLSSSLATVTMQMYSVDAATFSVSESLNFSTSPLLPYPNNPDRKHSYTYQASPAAGDKTLYVRFQNASGVYTVVNDTITFVGPTGYVLTTNDSLPLATYAINLRPFALGATEMLLTEDYALLASEAMWASFTYSSNFDLDSFTGKHTVYAKYRNSGHIETPVISLDVNVTIGESASPSIILNGGDSFTSSSRVEVAVATAPDYSTVMYLSETGDFFGVTATQTLATTSFEFSDKLPGAKTLYVRFKHNTRNEFITVSDTITARGPTNPSIETRDAQPMNKKWVELDLFAEGASYMKLSTSIASLTNAAWVPYDTKFVPFLLPFTGEQTIYCKYKNSLTNWVETVPVTLKVTVNDTSPTGNSAAFRASAAPTSATISDVKIASLPVYLHFTITDPNTATISYQLVQAGDDIPTTFVSKTAPVAPVEYTSSAFPGNGTFNLYYKFSDLVGNETSLSVVSINVLGPVIKISPQAAGPFFAGDSQAFSALKENVEGTIRWRISAPVPVDPLKHGTVNSSGLYTAPVSVTSPASISVSAYLAEDPAASNTVSFDLKTRVEVVTAQTDYKIKKGDVATITVNFINSTATGTISVPAYGIASIAQVTVNKAELVYTAPATPPNPAQKIPIIISSLEDPTRTKTIYFEVTEGTYVAINPPAVSMRVKDGSINFTAATSAPDGTTVYWSLLNGGSFDLNASMTITSNLVTNGEAVVTVYASPSMDIASSPLRVKALIDETPPGPDPYAVATITLTPKAEVIINPEQKEVYVKDTKTALFVAAVDNTISDSEVTWEFINASETWADAKSADGVLRPNGTLDLSGKDALYLPPSKMPNSPNNSASVSAILLRAVSREDNTVFDVATITLRELRVVIHRGYEPNDPVKAASVTLEVGQQKFYAEVSPLLDTSIDSRVTWSIQDIENGNSSYGTIDNSGLYIAPQEMAQPKVTLKAVSKYNANFSATAEINLLNFWASGSTGLQSVTSATLPVYCLRIDQTTASGNPRLIYAGTNGNGVFKSSIPALAGGDYAWDSTTWGPTYLASLDVGASSSYLINDIAISVQHSSRLVAATNNGLHLSTDGGTSFMQLQIPYPRPAATGPGFTDTDYTFDFTKVMSAVIIDPGDDTYMYAVGRDQGVVRFKWDTVPEPDTYTYDGTLYDDDQIFSVPEYYSWTWDQNTGSVATPTLVSGTQVRPRKPSDPVDNILHRSASGTMEFTCVEMSVHEPGVLYVGFKSFLSSRSPDVFKNGYLKLTNVRDAEYLFISQNALPVTGAEVPNGILLASGFPNGNPETVTNWFYVGFTGIISFDNDSSIIHSIAIDPNTPTTMWQGKTVGVFRSTDGGSSFTQMNTINPVNVKDIFIDPINTINIYIGTEAGLYRSRDAGATWKQIKSGLAGHATINTLGLSPGSVGARRIICGTTGGIFIGGKSLDLE
ncbi:MAG TPA: hypothetical protein PLM07_11105, partial [Candidatus Rifleibacterium sp.]|nr:hypothetical protein [Candidatus Rifleibacterium sp.]